MAVGNAPTGVSAGAELYEKRVNPQWVRLLDLLGMNQTYTRCVGEELRTALGVSTYYNEALGSTCHYSVYDRVKGRTGDIPDESVGAHETPEH